MTFIIRQKEGSNFLDSGNLESAFHTFRKEANNANHIIQVQAVGEPGEVFPFTMPLILA